MPIRERVSVVIPAYNAEAHLDACLAAALVALNPDESTLFSRLRRTGTQGFLCNSQLVSMSVARSLLRFQGLYVFFFLGATRGRIV